MSHGNRGHGREPTLSDTLSALLPNVRDTELLRAALVPGSEGQSSWVRWREGVRDVRSALAERRPLLAHLLPLLRSNTRSNGTDVDEEFRLAMAAATLQEERRAESVFEILADALEILNAAGVDAAVLKGAALAASVYPTKALRHCHDIDLLVPPDRLDRAEAALIQSGRYRSSEKAPSPSDRRVVHRSGLPVEVHGQMLRLFSNRRAEEAVLARRQTLRSGDRTFQILSPGDALWHVCGHAASGGNRGTLQWAADGWHLVERFASVDWSVFRAGVREMDQALPVYVCLRYLSRTLGANIPEAELGFLRGVARRARRRVRERVLVGALCGGQTSVHDLWSATRSARSRLFLARWRALPTSDYLAAIYPERSRLGVWTLYPKRILSYAFRPIRRAARRRRSRVLPRRPWMPTERQALLVRAALLDGEPAIDAWNRWKAAGDAERIDDGSSALLPVVYRNLTVHGLSDPAINLAQQAYKITWLENERRFREIGGLLEALNAAGIETMILKGAALALLYYRDLGLRSMGDVDVLVRPQRVRDAVALLTARGFRVLDHPASVLTNIHLLSRKAINLASDTLPKLDLHWRTMREVRSEDEEAAFWEGSAAVALCGVPTRVMDPADQVLHVCAHEAQWCSSPLPRWLVDLAMIFRAAGDTFDVEQVLDRASRLELASPVAEMLGYLATNVPDVVPRELSDALCQVHPTRRDRREYEVRCHRFGALRILRSEYMAYCDQTPGRNAIHRWIGFPGHCQALWGLKRRWQLVPHVVSWEWRAIRRTMVARTRGARRARP
ncbi:MAG: nucleotidyltransferase family protein [Candidatus Bipolaricaulis sp.]|nr:nucleotidyltransferase family protein [Candidatus Bipolaricaulis sp.]